MSSIKDIYNLTPVQEGMYAQYRKNGSTQAYQLRFLLQINKEADLSLLNQSVLLLALRHEVLRSAFAVSKSTGAVKQVVLNHRTPAFRILSQDAPFQQSLLDAVLKQDAATVFDLQNDVLCELTVIDFKDARYLYIHTHHMILDGWSLPLLLKDLSDYYDALVSGTDKNVLEQKIRDELQTETSFAAYVNWIGSLNREAAFDYWQTLLKNYNAHRIYTPATNGSSSLITKDFSFSEETSTEIEAFAKKHKLTPNTVFECVAGLAVQKYKGTNDVVFGKVISGRHALLKRIDRTVGPFINTIPVRLKTKPSASPLSVLNQLQRQSVSSAEYGFLSLPQLCKVCELDSKAIDTLFVFENYPAADEKALRAGMLQLRPVSFQEQTEFPFTVTVMKKNGSYLVRAAASSAQYSNWDLLCFLDTLQESMRRLIAMPEQLLTNAGTVSAFHALTSHETRRILYDFNDTAVSYDKERSVYDLFEAQVKKGGQACIRDERQTCTFAQLNDDASRIDAYIRQTVGAEKQVVGVLCDRSYAQLAAIFGIVRGGNVYLPISPRYPSERMQTMLQTSGCKLVLAQKQYAQMLECACCVENILAQAVPDTLPAPAAKPDDALYVIYTSGSTGTPKGAMVTNRSAVNRIQWMANRLFDEATVVMLKTPYTFDVSVWEIFGFAMCGFSLYILPPDAHYSQNEVLAHIERGQVTDLHFVPTVFEQFLSALDHTPDAKQKLRSVRHLILSGESLLAKDVNAFRKYHDGQITVHNLYGPAECAVDVTAYTCAETETDPIPIGKPIANTQIYILDNYMQPVPIGVTGELCIAGDNVGLGYLNRPELTTEKFVDNPFGEGKLYKTGDLAHWRADGNIVFVGRNDFQVKLNGQRVEPGEIETALSAIEGVDSAAVIVKKDETDRPLLCAFYTGKEIPTADLRALLSRTLPRYMVPQVFVHLETMPLTASGKTDRSALPAANITPQADAAPCAPAKTPLEEEICRAFCHVLKLDRVGRDNSFYDLGGTSLDMMRLLSVAPLSALSPATFMQNPVPAVLAQILARQEPEQTNYLQPLYVPQGAQKALVLFPYGGGDAAAYTALIAEARRHTDPLAFYYVHWMEPQAYPLAAEEIRTLASKTQVVFYSHCAGAVIAMKLLDLLNCDATVVRSYIAGANIPLGKYGRQINLWPLLSDHALLRILRRAGLPAEKLEAAQRDKTIRDFRKNADECFAYFAEKTKKTPCELHIVLSEKDLFTRNHRRAEKMWSQYVTNVQAKTMIHAETHYFQSEKSDVFYQILKQILSDCEE